MDLMEWLKVNNMKQTTFSKLVGVCDKHLNSVIRKRGVPSMRLCTLIEIVTKGKVTVHDILNNKKCPCCDGRGYIQAEKKNG